MRLVVGIADVLPKLIAFRILERAFEAEDPIQVTVREGKADRLIAELSLHGLDLVLADEPISPSVRVRAYNHLLGECGVTVFGASGLAEAYADGFPRALDGAPFLLPTDNTYLRRSLDQWFESQRLHPRVVAEFEDSALLKVAGQSGNGLFVAPTAIESEVCRQYRVTAVGRIEAVRERFYAISIERRIKNAAVQKIVETTRHRLFNGGSRRSV
jgi:LysR family transcriptional activator of nhaA